MVVVGLVGCIIAAVLNCNITGVTGVGQSTSNCCCAQEAKSENAPSGGLGGFGLPGVTVVMTSPLQQLPQQQQQIGITTTAWPSPPPEQHPNSHWITPANMPIPTPPQLVMYPGSPPIAEYPLPPPPTGQLELVQKQQQQQEMEQPATTTTTTITLV